MLASMVARSSGFVVSPMNSEMKVNHTNAKFQSGFCEAVIVVSHSQYSRSKITICLGESVRYAGLT